MPWASRSSSRESPSQPGKVKWALAGSRPPAPGRRRGSRPGPPYGPPRPGRRAGRRSRARTTRAARRRGGRPPRRRRWRGRRGCRSGRGAPGRRRAGRGRGPLAAEDQGADAVRAADLVTGDRHRGKAGGGEVDGDLAEGLDGVGVQRDAELRGDVGEFADRQDRADLVVGPHDRGQGDVVGVTGDRRAQGVGVDPAVRVDGEVLDGGALVFAEPVDGVEDGVVFDGARENPRPCGVRVAPGPVQALHGEVVGLRAAGGEDDLTGPGAERLREGLAGFLDRAAGPAAGCVEGRGVAGGAEMRGECLDRLGEHRGGRGVVEVCHGDADSTGRM